MIISTEDAIRKGSMSMSVRRVSAPGASLVCSVLSTRWPVSEARMAMSAVSRSRISPTIITSGSWRSTARSECAKVRPMSACTWVWFTPGTSYSTGSSTVMIRRSGRLIRRINAVKEVDLPEPVGPVTRTIPWGAASVRITFSSSSF